VIKIFTYFILGALIVTFTSCAKTQEQKELKTIDNNISIRLEGSVYAGEKQDIISSVGGFLKNVYVKNGDKVRKGDKIYSLDKEIIKLDIKNKEEQIASLEKIKDYYTGRSSGITSIPAINASAYELKRVAYLRSMGYINSFEANKYKKNYINALYANKNNSGKYEKVENLQRQIQTAKIELEKLKYNLKHADAYASIDGYISDLNINKGESIAPSRKVCSIVDLDKVIVKAGFSTGLLPYIKNGKEVHLYFVTTPPYNTYGKIDKINPIVDPKFDRMTFEVKIPNKNYLLQEGTRALVTISLSKKGQEEVRKYFLQNKRDTVLEIKSKI